MAGTFLVRGMLAGLLAAVIAFGFATLYAEPTIERAISFEERHEHTHSLASSGAETPATPQAGDAEAFSRQTQSGIGLLTGLSVIGLAMGGVFSITFIILNGRMGPRDPRILSLCIALTAYVILVLVPGIKYPANPPAVGSPETIGLRTALFFGMVAISIAAALLALQTARLVSTSLGVWNGSLLGIGTFLMIVVLAYAALPTFSELPEGFSADLLWRFRLSAFGTQAVLWSVIGVTFGFLAERTSKSRTIVAH
ncbi:CbtA family protein [Agrobacterium vitis]|uniref:CbtA family protein n=1 Tax=Agrobacterium vitis TaxID=373 RepID=UPI001574C8FA|nr:CbtA family protein [Agrobacterium vitis]NSZ19917.1 CbtA family protein [Agrobacterium vitis]QZO07621.1 CbtA family protein [Agrobacterium vitis]UJL90817.1 CbtA family protein [Agrobacterium vitis]